MENWNENIVLKPKTNFETKSAVKTAINPTTINFIFMSRLSSSIENNNPDNGALNVAAKPAAEPVIRYFFSSSF